MTATEGRFRALSAQADEVLNRRTIMNERTCAACDCPLDDAAISVKVGGKAVEVCCQDCAVALNEAGAGALPEA
jgi:hypothetical protein